MTEVFRKHSAGSNLLLFVLFTHTDTPSTGHISINIPSKCSFESWWRFELGMGRLTEVLSWEISFPLLSAWGDMRTHLEMCLVAINWRVHLASHGQRLGRLWTFRSTEDSLSSPQQWTGWPQVSTRPKLRNSRLGGSGCSMVRRAGETAVGNSTRVQIVRFE